MEILVIGSENAQTAALIREECARSGHPDIHIIYQPEPTPPMNFKSLMPLIGLTGISGLGSACNTTSVALTPPKPLSNYPARGAGKGGYKPKKTSAYHNYKRPSKTRRPETRFHRLNVFRNKFNLWSPSQLSAE